MLNRTMMWREWLSSVLPVHTLRSLELILCLVGGFLAVAPEARADAPGACEIKRSDTEKAAVFEKDDFGGLCAVVGVGEYWSPKEMGLAAKGFRSVKLGSGVEATACRMDERWNSVSCLRLSHGVPTWLGGMRMPHTYVYLRVARWPDDSCDERVLSAGTALLRLREEGGNLCKQIREGRYTSPAELGLLNVKDSNLENVRDQLDRIRQGLAPLTFTTSEDKEIVAAYNTEIVVCYGPGMRGCFRKKRLEFHSFSSPVSITIRKTKLDCEPSPGEAAVFAGLEPVGLCVTLKAGLHQAPDGLGEVGRDARLVRVASGTRVRLCYRPWAPAQVPNCFEYDASDAPVDGERLLSVDVLLLPT